MHLTALWWRRHADVPWLISRNIAASIFLCTKVMISMAFLGLRSYNDSLTRSASSNKYNQDSGISGCSRQNLMWSKFREQSHERRKDQHCNARRDQTRDFSWYVGHDEHGNNKQQASECCHGKPRQSLLMPDITICLVTTDIAELGIAVIFSERQHATGKDVARYEPGCLENAALEGVC